MKKETLKRGQRGAVMMEYVIICVLIAAACVLAVVVFSRSVLYGFDSARRGALVDSQTGGKAREAYQGQIANDLQKVKEGASLGGGSIYRPPPADPDGKDVGDFYDNEKAKAAVMP